jgi:hypothetical protein
MRNFYEVVPDPSEPGGWHLTRNGLVLKWYPDQIDAVIDGVDRAVKEAQGDVKTCLRVKGKGGRIEQEHEYPRSS